jgi:hypothetical protein
MGPVESYRARRRVFGPGRLRLLLRSARRRVIADGLRADKQKADPASASAFPNGRDPALDSLAAIFRFANETV